VSFAWRMENININLQSYCWNMRNNSSHFVVF
jgi:hypothetical protein